MRHIVVVDSLASATTATEIQTLRRLARLQIEQMCVQTNPFACNYSIAKGNLQPVYCNECPPDDAIAHLWRSQSAFKLVQHPFTVLFHSLLLCWTIGWLSDSGPCDIQVPDHCRRAKKLEDLAGPVELVRVQSPQAAILIETAIHLIEAPNPLENRTTFTWSETKVSEINLANAFDDHLFIEGVMTTLAQRKVIHKSWTSARSLLAWME